jgi:hypothetical protein
LRTVPEYSVDPGASLPVGFGRLSRVGDHAFGSAHDGCSLPPSNAQTSLQASPSQDGVSSELVNAIFPCLCSAEFVAALADPAFSGVLSGNNADATASFLPLFCSSEQCRTYLALAFGAGFESPSGQGTASTVSLSAAQRTTVVSCTCSRTALFNNILTTGIADQVRACAPPRTVCNGM